jgi:uncharacterized damage-inducible protein DinB
LEVHHRQPLRRSHPRPDRVVRLPRPAPGGTLAVSRPASAIHKLEDLDGDQLRWKPAPTANALGEIVVHLGYAERLWLRIFFAGEKMDMSWRQRMFVLPAGWSVEDATAFYRAETNAADSVLDGATSFDLASASDMRPTTLRWVVTHLLEETARHVGHMDITRELLDGRTGR